MARPRPPARAPAGAVGLDAGWDELAGATSYRCPAVDLRGFGASDPPTRPRLSASAPIAEALEQFGVGSAIVIGHSLGGAVATALAERIQASVTALVLCAPVGFGRLPLAELAALRCGRSPLRHFR